MIVPSEVAYVTACALGLAYSDHHDDDAVIDLLRAADGCPEVLAAARHALPGYASADSTVTRAADDLLASAEGAARLASPTAR